MGAGSGGPWGSGLLSTPCLLLELLLQLLLVLGSICHRLLCELQVALQLALGPLCVHAQLLLLLQGALQLWSRVRQTCSATRPSQSPSQLFWCHHTALCCGPDSRLPPAAPAGAWPWPGRSHGPPRPAGHPGPAGGPPAMPSFPWSAEPLTHPVPPSPPSGSSPMPRPGSPSECPSILWFEQPPCQVTATTPSSKGTLGKSLYSLFSSSLKADSTILLKLYKGLMSKCSPSPSHSAQPRGTEC